MPDSTSGDGVLVVASTDLTRDLHQATALLKNGTVDPGSRREPSEKSNNVRGREMERSGLVCCSANIRPPLKAPHHMDHGMMGTRKSAWWVMEE